LDIEASGKINHRLVVRDSAGERIVLVAGHDLVALPSFDFEDRHTAETTYINESAPERFGLAVTYCDAFMITPTPRCVEAMVLVSLDMGLRHRYRCIIKEVPMQNEQRQEVWNPESTAAFWINRASRALLRHFDARLRPLGFAMSHLPVLRALASGGSLSQIELAQAARVEQPTMAETLVRMVRDGVAQRGPNPNDKRGTLVSLTRRSRARLSKARAALVQADREAMAGLTNAEKALLRQLLERVVANLESLSGSELSSDEGQPIPALGGIRSRNRVSTVGNTP
jgi:MarR family transcriptional regulator, transcriptional regulator for hemolysin